jgi:hypothetical protein
MARHRGPVLLDTNVIIESSRIGAWRALAGGYQLETVEAVEVEALTGAQHANAAGFRASFQAIHAVSNAERAAAFIRDEQVGFLDEGELALWAHALTRQDDWILCGPDKASLRLGIRLSLRARLVALERLLDDAGYRPKVKLRDAYTQRWHERTLAELAQQEGGPS